MKTGPSGGDDSRGRDLVFAGLLGTAAGLGFKSVPAGLATGAAAYALTRAAQGKRLGGGQDSVVSGGKQKTRGSQKRRTSKKRSKTSKTLKTSRPKKWIAGVVRSKKFRSGAFSRQARARGMSTKQFMTEVLAHPNRYELTTRRRAQFLKNIQRSK